MQFLPIAVKFGVLGLLSAGWLTLHRHINVLAQDKAYHLAAYQRDQRKARFYFRSVWIGLIAAFLCFGCLETLSGVTFESPQMREFALGLVRGLGLWGLLITGAVWARVGQRASLPNSDGTALIPVPDEKYPRA
jgi:hypothetical protein